MVETSTLDVSELQTIKQAAQILNVSQGGSWRAGGRTSDTGCPAPEYFLLTDRTQSVNRAIADSTQSTALPEITV